LGRQTIEDGTKSKGKQEQTKGVDGTSGRGFSENINDDPGRRKREWMHHNRVMRQIHKLQKLTRIEKKGKMGKKKKGRS